MLERVDAIVIGAGEAGSIVASRAIQAGKRVALIYREPYGSTCLNTGCVPSKFLIHRARVAHTARVASRFHISVSPPQIHLDAIVREKNEKIRLHREESYRGAQAAENLILVEGEARFLSSRGIAVSGRSFGSDQIFIATGMKPLIPKIKGLDRIPFLTSDSLMELEAIPEQMIIIGGGYVACELGQTFRRYGSAVTIIQSQPHLLPREEPDVSTLLEKSFRSEGIEVILGYKAVEVSRKGSRILVEAESKAGDRRRIEGTDLLIAAGRLPNTDRLDLEKAGVQTDQMGFVRVNDFLQASVPGIWAAGDVNGRQPFTRVCQEEGKVAYANAFEGAQIKMDRRFLGHAIFTDPEIGSVGLTEGEARAAGYDIAAGLVTFDKVEKAELIGETTGLIKYVIDRTTRQILGCHVIGPDASNLIYDAIIVMRHGGTIDEIAKSVGIFPTLQEGMEGTARGLLRRVAPEEVRGPLVAGLPLLSRGGETTMAEEKEQNKEKKSGLECPACGAEFETQEQLNDHGKKEHEAAA